MDAESASAMRRALTRPTSIAIIGASNDPHKLTARPQRFLKLHGFEGRVFPVNPHRQSVLGVPALRNVADAGQPIDHAYILLDADAAVDAVEQCVAAGVKVISVLADGFAESGVLGAERQARLVAAADAAGVCLLGPNSMGVVDTRSGFVCTTNAAFATPQLNTGETAVISHSGSLIGTILSRGQSRGLGYSTLVSVGNEATMGVGEIGQLLVDDPHTQCFLLFLETLRNPHSVARFARRANELGKPVLAYVLGRTEEGQALSVSHTGALVDSASALAGFLDHHGIRRIDNFETLIEGPPALAVAPRCRARPQSVVVVTTTGGGGAMVVDQLSARGVRVQSLPQTAESALARYGIHVGGGKLVDVTLAGARYDTMKAVMAALIRDREVGLVVVAIGSSAQFNPELSVRPILDAVNEANDDTAPVMAFPLPQADDALRLFAENAVAGFRTVESCAEAVALVLTRAEPADEVALAPAPSIAAQLKRREPGVMNEVEASDVFQALGIPIADRIVIAIDASAPESLPFPYPCVAKVVSSQIVHKTDAQLVETAIGDGNALRNALARLRERAVQRLSRSAIGGIVIQPMYQGLAEVIVGLKVDRLIGPVVNVGMGGVLTEIYQDIAVRPAPVSLATALGMIDAVRGFAVLKGYRGAPKADIAGLADVIVKVSRLGLINAVGEAEINPLLVDRAGRGVVAVDAVIKVSAPACHDAR